MLFHPHFQLSVWSSTSEISRCVIAVLAGDDCTTKADQIELYILKYEERTFGYKATIKSRSYKSPWLGNDVCVCRIGCESEGE